MDNKELDFTFAKMANAKHYGIDYREWEEHYIKNASKRQEKGKKSIDWNSLFKGKIATKTKAIIGLVSLGAVAFTHFESTKAIANHVYEADVFPEGMSVRNDSNAGIIVSYADAYGNRQTVSGDYFASMVLEEGLEKGFNADEVAIALDYCTGYDASAVKESSFLGRAGQEMRVLGGVYNIEGQMSEALGEEISSGRGSR